MTVRERIIGFPYSYKNNDDIVITTNNLKSLKNWQSYRIATVLLLPCPLIKIIYHLATGILGALTSDSNKQALHNLKWMWSSCYQDLRELVGHIVLVVPYCNDAGFTMVASAMAFKKSYIANYEKDMKVFQSRFRAGNALQKKFDELFDELIDTVEEVNEEHNKIIEEEIKRREENKENGIDVLKEQKDCWKNFAMYTELLSVRASYRDKLSQEGKIIREMCLELHKKTRGFGCSKVIENLLNTFEIFKMDEKFRDIELEFFGKVKIQFTKLADFSSNYILK